MLADGTFDNITKKERLTLSRDKDKMEKVLGGISQLARVPAALFIVDISHEHIALAEAKRLGVSTFGMVDTNSDPTKVDFAIPANDDATKSIAIIVSYIAAAIAEGLAERAVEKTDEVEEEETDNKLRKFELEGGDERGERGRRPGGPGGRTGGPGGNRGGGAGNRGGGAGRSGGGNRPGGNRPGGNRPGGGGGSVPPVQVNLVVPDNQHKTYNIM